MLIAAGLVLQAVALVLVFRRLGRAVLIHIGAIFIVLATVYHGLNEILVRLFPDRDPYRFLVSADYVSTFTFYISVTILVLTLVYLGALGGRQQPAPESEIALHRERIRRVFDWRLMLAAAAPLIVLTASGNGYFVSPGNLVATQLDPTVGLASQFLLLALVLASLGFISRFGRRWILPVLLVQSIAAALVGERLEILVTAVMLLYALSRLGIPIQARQLSLAVMAFIVVGLVVTSARASAGHISTVAGGSFRLDYLVAGLNNVSSPATWDQIAFDLGYRFDGNSFGAMELQSLDQGSPPLGFAPLMTDIAVAVPSFLNPDKNYSPIETRSEKEYAEIHLGLPLPYVAPGLHQDILPTQLGATIGFWGPGGMVVVALFLGLAFAMLDRWVLSRLTPSRFLIGISLMSCVLFYERSWNTYTGTFRGLLLLLPLIWALQSYHAAHPRFRRSSENRGLGVGLPNRSV
jgi:hypothetical protein